MILGLFKNFSYKQNIMLYLQAWREPAHYRPAGLIRSGQVSQAGFRGPGSGTVSANKDGEKRDSGIEWSDNF